jgi:peroxiredoxin
VAPAFTLPTAKGNWSLDEGLGKSSHVVLVFYRGDW